MTSSTSLLSCALSALLWFSPLPQLDPHEQQQFFYCMQTDTVPKTPAKGGNIPYFSTAEQQLLFARSTPIYLFNLARKLTLHTSSTPSLISRTMNRFPSSGDGQSDHFTDETLQSTSLNLLLPRPSISTVFPSESAQTLEQQSSTIVLSLDPTPETNEGYNFLDPAHFAECLPCAALPQTTFIELQGRDELIRYRSNLKIRHPEIILEIVDAVSKINQSRGTAVVYLTCRLSRYSIDDMPPRESIVIFDWEHKPDSGWICVKSKFVHGYSSITPS